MPFYKGEKLCLASKQTARYMYLPKQSQHCFHGPHADCVPPRCLCSLFHCRKAKMDSAAIRSSKFAPCFTSANKARKERSSAVVVQIRTNINCLVVETLSISEVADIPDDSIGLAGAMEHCDSGIGCE